MIVDFNIGWEFSGEHTYSAVVNLPHDAMLTEKRNPNCHNGKQSDISLAGNIHINLSDQIGMAEWKAGTAFEGVYQNCRVLVNEAEVCRHKYGYTEFTVDISKAVHAGENQITVLVDNSLEPNCRWYSGSGIYRPVWLLVDELLTPKIITKSYDPAVIEVTADEGTRIEIWDGETLVVSGLPGTFLFRMPSYGVRKRPTFTPALPERMAGVAYQLRHTQTGMGRKTGPRVNGKRVLLRGGCIHHDNGVLGLRLCGRRGGRCGS